MECDNCGNRLKSNPPKFEYEGLLLCEKCFLKLFNEDFSSIEKAQLIGARIVYDITETRDWF